MNVILGLLLTVLLLELLWIASWAGIERTIPLALVVGGALWETLRASTPA